MLKQSDLTVPRAITKWARKTLIRLLPLIHGKRGRARVAMFVLLEYMMSLVVVAASAILFWGIAIKAGTLNSLSLFDNIALSISGFLPGVPAPVEASLPFWTSVGPAATSWILFVLYIGPASSLLPKWQNATLKGFTKTYQLLREAAFLYGKVDRSFKRIEKKIPS